VKQQRFTIDASTFGSDTTEGVGMPPTSTTPRLDNERETRRQQLLEQIAALGPVLPGSLVQRSSSCGNPGCKCRADPPQLHGPYWAWTRAIEGKTRTRSLSTEQAQRYQPWFDNAARLRELITELKDLTAEQLQDDLDHAKTH
jgi:hypothetical protein